MQEIIFLTFQLKHNSEDIREGLVQAEFGGNLPGTPLQHHEEHGDEHHPHRTELGKPRHHNGSESAATRQGGGQGMVGGTHQQEAGNAADSTGEEHGADAAFPPPDHASPLVKI